ncbi:MAG: CDP-alcohol phosphatidyltransferase family protein [Acidobacteriota bacterium]
MPRRVAPFDYQHAVKQGHQLPVLRYLNVDRFVHRPLGALVVRAVYPTRISPNQITYASFVVGVVAAACFCLPVRGWVVAGACLQLLSNVLDSADGMLARAKGLGSRFGATLDLMLDRIGDLLLYGSTIVAYYNATGDARLAIAGLVGLSAFNLQVTLYYLVEQYRKAERTGMSGETRALASWAIVVCALAGRFDLLMWLMILEPIGNIVYRLWYFHHLPADPA